MIFYYVRHGDPIYNPDSLTPLGIRQAEAVAKRLTLHGLDKIYSSTSNRAMMTAKPTCEILKLEPELLDFANEAHAWDEMSVEKDEGEGKTWVYLNKRFKEILLSKEVRDLGDRWYEHPAFAPYPFKQGVERVYDALDTFFADLGYEHIRYSGRYKITKPNDQRVALFAHHGFGMLFLSCLLDIPYPMICTHFDMCHSGVTAIDFKEVDGYAVPKVMTLSSEAHLYREGLPTKYHNKVYI